jgi:hypothetical protein
MTADKGIGNRCKEDTMPSRFSLAQVETAKANLDALPAADKDTREVGLQVAIKALAPTIRKLAGRGYSRKKILELLREQGIPVSGSTLKHYLGEKRSRWSGQEPGPSKDTEAAGRGAESGPVAGPEPRLPAGSPAVRSGTADVGSSRPNGGPAKVPTAARQ